MIKTNFIFLILIAILFQICACNQKKKKNDGSAKESNLIDYKQIDTTFGFFWANFQKAAINNDFQTLIKLTIFPLETRGPQDEDKIVKYDESEFKIVFETFLKEDTEPDLTEFDLLKKLVNFDSKNQKDFTIYKDEARVGEKEYKKINGQWKLRFLYLYYGAIDEVNKKLNKK